MIAKYQHVLGDIMQRQTSATVMQHVSHVLAALRSDLLRKMSSHDSVWSSAGCAICLVEGHQQCASDA